MMPAMDHAILQNWGAGYEHGIDSATGASADYEVDGNSAVARKLGGDGEQTEAGGSAGGQKEKNDVCGCAEENRNGAAVAVEKDQGSREEVAVQVKVQAKVQIKIARSQKTFNDEVCDVKLVTYAHLQKKVAVGG
jgi:hypothetical protein